MVPDATTDATELFKRFITYDSGKRISARDALRHDYFANQPAPALLSEMPRPDRAGKGRDSGGVPRVSAANGLGGVGKEYEVDQSFTEVFEDLLELRY